jgi:polysaccharide biosynthesis protein PslG
LNGGFARGVVANMLGWGTGAAGVLAGEMSSLGVGWTREDLKWSNVEPQRGVFDWSAFDAMLGTARAHGISVLPVVGYAPAWASPGDASDYAAFVAAAVTRYGPGTTADLQWFELWNEPYFAYAWGGSPGNPAAYARDVRAASAAAKAVAPSVRVLIAASNTDSPAAGNSSGWWTTSVDDYFAAVPDLGQWIDGVAVHPYGDDPAFGLTQSGGWRDASGGASFARIDSIRASFLAHGVNVPFWITEVGVSTADVSAAAQSQYYADLMPAVRARPWVRALFPYCLREFNAHPTDDEPGYGLETYSSWAPKPAYYTLKQGLTTLH